MEQAKKPIVMGMAFSRPEKGEKVTFCRIQKSRKSNLSVSWKPDVTNVVESFKPVEGQPHSLTVFIQQSKTISREVGLGKYLVWEFVLFRSYLQGSRDWAGEYILSYGMGCRFENV